MLFFFYIIPKQLGMERGGQQFSKYLYIHFRKLLWGIGASPLTPPPSPSPMPCALISESHIHIHWKKITFNTQIRNPWIMIFTLFGNTYLLKKNPTDFMHTSFWRLVMLKKVGFFFHLSDIIIFYLWSFRILSRSWSYLTLIFGHQYASFYIFRWIR